MGRGECMAGSGLNRGEHWHQARSDTSVIRRKITTGGETWSELYLDKLSAPDLKLSLLNYSLSDARDM